MVASLVDPDILYGQIAEILQDRLYFASFKSVPKPEPNVRYVKIDDKVHYEPFYSDFGPLNLSVLYRFCEYLHSLLESSKHKRKIFIFSAGGDKSRVNAAYLVAAYLIIYHRISADTAYLRVKVAEPPEFIGFRDAALGEPTYLLHLHDVLRGVEKALSLKWLDFSTFNAEEYEHYERVENGDLNWIIPGKILSFCGPHNESRIEDGYPYHSPETYFEYFRRHNVTTIIRLNMKMYEADKFIKAGFDHVDLFFIDGSTPSEEIVLKFLDIVDKAKGGVAVHCKAGLGRTGTLIACWMMKEYGLTAAECIAWLRICRPGSVIGPQQEFLVDQQKFCWSRSVAVHMARKKRDIAHMSILYRGLTSKVDDIRLSADKYGTCMSNGESSKMRPNILALRRTRKSSANEKSCTDETVLDERGRSQGDRLLAMKARSQASSKTSPNTNHSISVPAPAAYRTPEPSTPTKLERNGNLASMNPLIARSSAASGLLMSSRFSSPTTPIKQPSPMSTPSSYRSHLVLRNQHFVPPPVNVVSKVTVVPASKVTPVKMTSNSKSTSALRKIGGRTRTLPYPSQGTRVELAASQFNGYELRSRNSPPSSTLSAAAKALPPNSEALIGNRRKKRST